MQDNDDGHEDDDVKESFNNNDFNMQEIEIQNTDSTSVSDYDDKEQNIIRGFPNNVITVTTVTDSEKDDCQSDSFFAEPVQKIQQ